MESKHSNTVILNSVVACREWARDFAVKLSRPTVILISGDLGAGKTQFTSWMVEALGGHGAQVSSPTFAIHQRYNSPNGHIDHVDIYRIQSEQELETSGFWDLFASSDGMVIVEWGDRLQDFKLPQPWKVLRVHLEKIPGDNASARQVAVIL